MNALLHSVPHWLTTPLGVDAPSNDLKFWKDMQQFRAEDQAVADVALCALDRHLWYATEECAALSVFSSKVSDTEKAQIAKEILRRKSKYNENDLGQPTFPTLATGTKLKDLIGPKSWSLFSLFDKVDWLAKPVKSWSSDPSFQVIFEVVTHMKVVNDLAERGVKLMSDFAPLITNNEEQKQCLLQTVEQHRMYSNIN